MSTYWRRLLGFALLLGALPALAVGWVSYTIAAKGIEEKVIEGNMQVLLQTQWRTEQLLRNVELAAIQYASTATVADASDAPLSVRDYGQIRELSQGLAHLQTLPGVEEARFINLQHDWLLSYRHFRTLGELPDIREWMQYKDHPKSLFWIDRAVNQETPVVRMVLKLPSIPGTPARSMLTVDVLASEIRQQLTRSRELGDQIILSEGDGRLFAAGPDVPSGLYAGILRRIRDSGDREGFFYLEGERGKTGVAYRTSSYNDWIYASVVPHTAITGQSKQIAQWTWSICLSIAALAGLLAYVGSRRMYFPVRRLFEFARDIEEPADPGPPRDEFHAIEKRLRVLSDNGKAMRRQLLGHYSQLKEFFVFKLMLGQEDERELLRKSGIYGMPTEWGRLGVMSLQIDARDTRLRERDRDLLLFAAGNMVGELLPPHARFSPIVIDSAQVTLIVCEADGEDAARQALQASAELIRSKVNEYLKLEVSIGISRPFRMLRDANKAYYESLQALRRRFHLGSNVIVHSADTDSRTEVRAADYAQLKLIEDQVVHAIKMGDRRRTHALFDEYATAMMKLEGGAHDYTMFMLQLILKIYQILLERGISVRGALGGGATIETFMKLNTADEIAAWFRDDLFAPLFDYLHRQTDMKHVDIAGQMIRIIEERYDEELSLDTCSAILNLHPAYVSRVFKKEIGVNFTEYLSEYRMQVAKHWLEETPCKISDIAAKLKYTNTSAFIRMFRRIVGMTPGQYREQFRSERPNAEIVPDA